MLIVVELTSEASSCVKLGVGYNTEAGMILSKLDDSAWS